MLEVTRLPIFKLDLFFLPSMREDDVVWKLIAGEIDLIKGGSVEEAHRCGVATFTAALLQWR